MNTKHTPGPWHVEKHQRFIPYEIGGPGGSFEGVNTWFNLIVHEDPNDPRLRTPIAEVTVSTEAASNARLIAAAPELLAACKAFVAHERLTCRNYNNTDQPIGGVMGLLIAQAEAAIAKAEGEGK